MNNLDTNELTSLRGKIQQLKLVLENTKNYREIWTASLKEKIKSDIAFMTQETGLDVDIEVRDQITNLEAIVISLGKKNSGISERLEDDLDRPLIRHGGLLVYQQLFNGKILVMINYPFIEGYGEPSPPRNIAIYRPEEIKTPFILRHLEEFVKEIAEWEDYDDDDVATKKIGFNVDYQHDD